MKCIVFGVVSLGLYSMWIVDSSLPANFGVLEYRCGLTIHHTHILYLNVHEVHYGRDGFPRLIWCVDGRFRSSREFWSVGIQVWVDHPPYLYFIYQCT
jgi:hypothetical protein